MHTAPALTHAVRPTRQARPLELKYVTPLLLAEHSWTAPSAFALGVRVETLAIGATRVSVTLQEIPGYRHFGIND
jgi:hypothetical protein